MHPNMKIADGVRIPLHFSINKDGISIPEMDSQAEVAKFELNFPVSLDTYTGMVVEVPSVQTIKVQGGSLTVDPTKLDHEKTRVVRSIAAARTGNVDELTIEDIVIGLDDDYVSP